MRESKSSGRIGKKQENKRGKDYGYHEHTKNRIYCIALYAGSWTVHIFNRKIDRSTDEETGEAKMREGLFITFEGPDGSGKTTQIQKLSVFLKEKGYDTLLTREPGGTVIGEKIRNIILDCDHKEMNPIAEAMLYAASRAQHVAEVIIPALKEGRTVICDRFMDSSIAYQGYGRKLGDKVRIINEIAVAGLVPDLTFLLVVDPGEGKRRISCGNLDRLESEKIDYHIDVFNGYMELARKNSERIIVIDGTGEIDEISRIITGKVESFIIEKRGS